MDRTINTINRAIPPKPGKPKDIQFPDYFDVVTQDGINVLVIENHKIPSVSVRLVFKNTGSFFDGKLHGIAQLTSELLTKGTTKRTANQIAEEIDYIGASMNSGSDWDGSYISLSVLKKHLDKGVDVLADVVQNPIFAEHEINRLREQRLASIMQSKDDPSYLSDRLFNKIVFENTPYANPIEGTEKSLPLIKRDDILEHYHRHFKPSNLIIAFVGSITPEEAMNIITNKFIHWMLHPNNELWKNYLFTIKERNNTIYLVNKEESVQSNLKIGHLGITRNNEDFLGVSVLNTLLGGYFRSRLNMNLREKNGYTYGAHSSFHGRIYPGDFSIETDVRNEVTLDAIKEILNEIEKITSEPVSNEELVSVKNYMTGVFPLQLETANSVATRVINLKLYDLPKDYYNKYITNINKLKTYDIFELAKKYIFSDKMQIIVTGNASQIVKTLEKFGNVIQFDQDFNKIN